MRPRQIRAALGAATVCCACVAGAFVVGPAPADDSVVATWRGGSLSRADYDGWRTFHELEDSPDAIREMAFVESMAAVTRERGVDRDTRTRLELDAMRQLVLIPKLREHVEAQVTVSDEEVEAIRLENLDSFRRPRKLLLRQIYKRLDEDPETSAASRARMREILELVTRPVPDDAGDSRDVFPELARTESESQSRLRDGRLGYLDPEALPKEVAAAVRDLEPGQVTGLVEHGGGLSIFRCEEIREAISRSPEEARSTVRRNLLRQRIRARWDDYQRALLDGAAPRLLPAPEVALEMEGYVLRTEDLEDLLTVRAPGLRRADLSRDRLEELVRGWALGVLCVRRAVELGLDQEPTVATALRWRELDTLARVELIRRIDRRLQEPTDEELRLRYDESPQRYMAPSDDEVAAIHFGDGDDPELARVAIDVARRLEAGELTFEEAARRYSVDPSAAAGGYLGWISRHKVADWGADASRAFRGMRPGERSGLLHLESGLWIFEMRDHRDPRPKSFEQVRDQVRQQIRHERIKALEQTVRTEQLAGLDVVIAGPAP